MNKGDSIIARICSLKDRTDKHFLRTLFSDLSFDRFSNYAYTPSSSICLLQKINIYLSEINASNIEQRSTQSESSDAE